MAHISNKSCDNTSFEMKCLLICLAISLTASEKLDRTYLPPPGAQLAGGNPGDILTPFEPPNLPQTGSEPIAYGQKIYKGPKEQLLKLPVTTTSYAFTQTTTFPPVENSEAFQPINHGIRLTEFGHNDLQYNQELPSNLEQNYVNIQPDIPRLDHNQNALGPVDEVLIPGVNIHQPGSNTYKPAYSIDQQSSNIRQPGSDIHHPGSHVDYAGQPSILFDREKVAQGNILPQDQYSDARNQGVATELAPQGNSGLLSDNTALLPYNGGSPIQTVGSTDQQLIPQTQSTGQLIQDRLPQTGHENIVNFSTTPGYLSSSSAYSYPGIPSIHPERPQASKDRSATILNYENTLTPNSYSYSYDTSNGIHADESGIVDNGTKAKGSYSYTGDDGKIYTTFYTADENGFQPQGEHLPTSPPIPEAIQKVIEQAARDKEAGIIDDGSYDENKYGYKKYQTPTYDHLKHKNKFNNNYGKKQSEIRLPVNIDVNIKNVSHKNEFGNKKYNLSKDNKISDKSRSSIDLEEDREHQNNSKPSHRIFIDESKEDELPGSEPSVFRNDDYSKNSDYFHQTDDAPYASSTSHNQDITQELNDNRNQAENQADDTNFGFKTIGEKVSTTPTYTQSKGEFYPEYEKGYYKQKSTTPRPFMTSRVSTFRGGFSDYDNDEDTDNNEDDVNSTQSAETIDKGESPPYRPSQTITESFTTSTANPTETYTPRFVMTEKPRKISESLQRISSKKPVALNGSENYVNRPRRPYFNAVTTNTPIQETGEQFKDEINIPSQRDPYSPLGYPSTLRPVPSTTTTQVFPDYRSNNEYFKTNQLAPTSNENQYQPINNAYPTTHNHNVGYSEMSPYNTPENRAPGRSNGYTTISPKLLMTTAVSSTSLPGSIISSDFPSTTSQTFSSGYVYENPKRAFPTNPTFGNMLDFTSPSSPLNFKSQQFSTTKQPPSYSPVKNIYDQNPIVDGFGRPIISETHSEILSPNVNEYTGPVIPDGNVFRTDDGTSLGSNILPGDTPTYNVEQTQRPMQRYPGYNNNEAKIIGEHFPGPKQTQRYDPQTGYHYK